MATLSRVLNSTSSLGRCFLSGPTSAYSLTKHLLNHHLIIKRPFSNLFSTKFTRGDIVLFKGKREGEWGDVVHSKGRPYLIVSTDRVSEVTNRVVLSPLSTASARHRYEVVIPNDRQTGIHKPSKVMANQLFTAPLVEKHFEKIGSANNHLPSIGNALAICFGDYKVDEQLEISRGDIVEIDFGSFVREGVVVSNDIGNRASRIAMLAHSREKDEMLNEFDVVARKESDSGKEELLVQCYMIDTFAQNLMDKRGRIMRNDMEKITAMLFKTLGILK